MIELRGSKKASTVPFPAIVGQERLKRALLAVATDDGLGGLLVCGEKGTAKSTAVRALVDLLPDQRAVADCPYGCPPDDPGAQCADCRTRTDPPVETRGVPLVTLPLGATRERVVGTLSVADALDGEAEFDPGLLARANRGILYVDEVNLLDDHLVDVLLDAAASGVNRVERDGVSVSHPANFTLVGTMNPEEGDLRPQLKDRFALQTTVTGCEDIEDRVTILDRALGETGDLREGFADETADLADRLADARETLGGVTLPEQFKADIAELCRDAGVEGHRADISVARAARTVAALDGRAKVVESDVREAAELALPHRLRSRPFEDAPDPDDVLDDHFDDEADAAEDEGDEPQGDSDAEDSATEGGPNDDSGNADDSGPHAEADSEDSDSPESQSGNSDAEDSTSDDDDSHRGDRPGAESPADVKTGDGDEPDAADEDRENSESGGDSEGGFDESEEGVPLVPGQARRGVGEAERPDIDSVEADATSTATRNGDGSRAAATPSSEGRGAQVRTERAEAGDAVDAAASVRAAASRGADAVAERDLRTSVRTREQSALVVFAVDASVSMRSAMRTAKGVVLELLRDAYERRDEVAFVAFAGEDAEVLLPPTDSTDLAARHLKDLPVGDRTPLPAGLRTAGEVVERADAAASVVVVVTDGRANVASGSPTEATRRAARGLAERDAHVVVVDAGDSDRGLVGEIATAADGERIPLESLSPERVLAATDR
ncbi:VWA domain-containing protein [Halorussus sp. MSC15.2]|uniref:VWA domain-containing protein n=1 Tax=Halorussus sp. MSC15.2 TaxID=2283638 RepID=UPI0013D1E658|nr:VWA domain-containing protein [Halorussus sp. MSC15.2]NEU58221.1 VWA domain-containing protein [Halorussus sp. MSC15.2]